jgi:uncharacterized protein YndB with AHSA1/START domain
LAFAYLLAFILVFILTLLLLGYAAPRRYQVKVTRTLPAPPERVWAYVSDPERFPHWFPYVAACAHSGGPAQGVGQRRRVILDLEGRPGEREEEVTRWEEPRVIEIQHLWETREGRRVPWEHARSEFRIAPAESGTSFTGVLWFSGRGMMGRIFGLLTIRKRHERDFGLGLANLEKRLREESYPP